MRLLAICRPFFDTLTRLNREARNGGACSLEVARADVQAAFAAMRDAVLEDRALGALYQRVEPVLFFTVDYLIKEGPFPFSSAWQELAFQIGELAGDERFFDLLDETLNDPGHEATEVLHVFYACLAIGFDGAHAGDREWVQRRMRVVALRIHGPGVRSWSPALTPPSAIERFQHPAARWRRMATYAALFLLMVGIANLAVFRLATGGLRDALVDLLGMAPSERAGVMPDEALTPRRPLEKPAAEPRS